MNQIRSIKDNKKLELEQTKKKMNKLQNILKNITLYINFIIIMTNF